MPNLQLIIDGKAIVAEQGMTVLQATRRARINLPTLCEHEDLPPLGACGLCVVEIEGFTGPQCACTVPAAAGMFIRTESPALTQHRTAAMQKLLSTHANPCLLCDYRTDCDAFKAYLVAPTAISPAVGCTRKPGLTVSGMSAEKFNVHVHQPWYQPGKAEHTDPFIDRDYNLCTECGLCWRACEQVQQQPRARRGDDQARIRWNSPSWLESDCKFCGACVDACAGGALIDRYAKWEQVSALQPVTTCSVCPLGCPLKVKISNGRLIGTAMTRLDHATRLCAVGRFAYPQIVNTANRLRAPMLRQDDQLVPVEWSQALATIGQNLKTYQQQGQFVAIVSCWETRENTLMYELFARRVMNGQLLRIHADTRKGAIELLRREIRAKTVKAAIVAGDYLDAQSLAQLEYLVVADFHPSRACDLADAVLPVAILAELEGTMRTSDDRLVRVRKSIEPPGQARSEWTLLADLATAMGSDLLSMLNHPHNGALYGQWLAEPQPRDNLADLPKQFRGHLLTTLAPELAHFEKSHPQQNA